MISFSWHVARACVRRSGSKLPFVERDSRVMLVPGEPLAKQVSSARRILAQWGLECEGEIQIWPDEPDGRLSTPDAGPGVARGVAREETQGKCGSPGHTQALAAATHLGSASAPADFTRELAGEISSQERLWQVELADGSVLGVITGLCEDTVRSRLAPVAAGVVLQEIEVSFDQACPPGLTGVQRLSVTLGGQRAVTDMAVPACGHGDYFLHATWEGAAVGAGFERAVRLLVDRERRSRLASRSAQRAGLPADRGVAHA